MALTQVTSAGVKDGELVNADLHSSAAIALSKLGTSGTAGSGNFLRGDGAWTAIDLSGKLSLTGGTLTGNVNFNDNIRARFGASNDLQIWHDAAGGGYSYIFNYGPALLKIGSDTNIVLGKTSNENYLIAKPDGAVELYFDNTKKLNTHSNGITVAGNINMNDNYKLLLGSSGSDLEIYHDGSNSRLKNTTGSLWLQSDTGIRFTDADVNESMAAFYDNAAVELYYDGSKKFETNSSGVFVKSTIQIEEESGSEYYRLHTNGYGGLEIQNETTKVCEFTDASTLDFPDNNKIQLGTGSDLKIFHDGTNSVIRNTGGTLYLQSQSHIELTHRHSDNSEEKALFSNVNGAVELYHNGTKKFQTTSSGTHCFGQLEMDGSNNIDLQDNGALLLGTGDDLQIYHDGSASYISDVGTHGIFIQSDGPGVYIRGKTGEDSIKALSDGAVELYYDNSKKLETVSWGVNSDGYIKSSGSSGKFILDDSGALECGSSSDLKLYHNGTHSYIWNTQGDLQIRGDSVYICSTGGEGYLEGTANGSTKIFYDNVKSLETTATGCTISKAASAQNAELFIRSTNGGQAKLQLEAGGNQGGGVSRATRIDFVNTEVGTTPVWTLINDYDQNGTNDFRLAHGTEVAWKAHDDGAVELYYDNSKKLQTYSNGVEVLGNLWLQSGGAYHSDNIKYHFGNSDDLQIWHDGSNSLIKNSTGSLYVRSDSNIFFQDAGGNETFAKFIDNGAVELYFNNSKKFETYNGGCQMGGDLSFSDSQVANFGTGSDLQIYHDGTLNVIDASSGNLEIRHGAEKMIACATDGQVELYYDNTKTFQTSSVGNVLYKSQRISGTGADWADGDGGIKITGTTSAGRGNISMYYDSNILEVGAGITQKNRTEWHGHGGSNAIINYVGTNERFKVHNSGATVTGNLTVTGSITGAGKILQVVQAVKSNLFSTGAADTTFIDIPNLAASITPSSSSNKILVRVNIGKCACSQNQRQSNFRVFRGSTEIGRGDSAGSRIRCAFSIYHGGMNSSGGGWAGSWEYLDSPSTTSSTTYKVAMSGHNGDTHGINAALSDQANNTDAPQSRTISTVTLTEVSA